MQCFLMEEHSLYWSANKILSTGCTCKHRREVWVGGERAGPKGKIRLTNYKYQKQSGSAGSSSWCTGWGDLFGCRSICGFDISKAFPCIFLRYAEFIDWFIYFPLTAALWSPFCCDPACSLLQRSARDREIQPCNTEDCRTAPAMEKLLKAELKTTLLKAFGSSGGGCISQGQSYETDHGRVFVKINNKPQVKGTASSLLL